MAAIHDSRALIRRAVAVFAGTVLAGAGALAADMPEVVVEATAGPTHQTPREHVAPGGATVELLSIKYHVHVGALDVAKSADLAKLDEEISAAAKKGCDAIQNAYPLRTMSDAKSCVADAVKGAAGQRQALIAAAEAKAKK